MTYRFLGDSGLLVSRFALGSWVICDDEANTSHVYDIFVHGYRHGINFWDTAESYGAGAAERVLGNALRRGIAHGVWTRSDLVLSTKLYSGTKPGPNARGLSRKHLVEGVKASLQRLGTDYVDVLFCHRPEKFTPMEEIVRSMNFIITQGWAFYWGTSEWQAPAILEACTIADRLGMIRPIVEQPQYNLFERNKVEVEFTPHYKQHKLGLTTWSPLVFGILTGKYAHGVPDGARLTQEYHAGLVENLSQRAELVEQLRPLAAELRCTLAQLAIAWVASNEEVSTVLLGASSVEQLDENLKALPLVAQLTPEFKQRIEEIVPFVYKPPTYDRLYVLREGYL